MWPPPFPQPGRDRRFSEGEQLRLRPGRRHLDQGHLQGPLPMPRRSSALGTVLDQLLQLVFDAVPAVRLGSKQSGWGRSRWATRPSRAYTEVKAGDDPAVSTGAAAVPCPAPRFRLVAACGSQSPRLHLLSARLAPYGACCMVDITPLWLAHANGHDPCWASTVGAPWGITRGVRWCCLSSRRGPTAVTGTNPVARQRELVSRLRGLRNEKGLTVEEVAARLLCSITKISRLDNLACRPSLRDVRDLCALYEVDESTSAELMSLAREAREPGWWTKY